MTAAGIKLVLVAHPHQPYWFTTAAGAGGIALATITAVLHGSNPPAPFWTTGPMGISYALIILAVVAFFCGVTGQRFPLADGTRRQACPAVKNSAPSREHA